MTKIVKVGERGQITIPKEIRDKLGIVCGKSSVVFAPNLHKRGEWVIEALNETFMDIIASVPPQNEVLPLGDMDQIPQDAVVDKQQTEKERWRNELRAELDEESQATIRQNEIDVGEKLAREYEESLTE